MPRGGNPYVALSLNESALARADRLAAEADRAGVAVTTLANGTRLIDCGAKAPGGFEAGRAFAEICMGGLGSVAYAPVALEGRWLPALTVTTDRPAVACLASQYAGWRIDRDGYFAMGSGPGRALIRAEDLYDDLDWDEQASAAVLCLETRDAPPAEVADFVAERAGVAPPALTLVMAPTASIAGGVQIAARVVETALHKLHELDFDVRRVVAGYGSCPLPPVAGDDMAAIGRTNDAVLYGGQVDLTVESDDDDALRELVERLPASASSDYGEPFGKVLEDAEYDFYKIDPLLFSPAQIRLTSVGSGRSFEAGTVNVEVLERSFWG
jgi:methenyltetrahydromethanopterin cyclohydrolase